MGDFREKLCTFFNGRTLGLKRVGKLKRWLAISDDPNLLAAQYANLKRQIPLLYLLLIVTALAAFYTFANSAPLLLISSVTLLMVGVGTVRFVTWVWFSSNPEDMNVDELIAVLRRTRFAVVPICLVYVCYALVLDQYAGPVEQAGLAVCVVLTAIGCIFCLMHLPQAGLLVHVITMVPYTIYHVYQGNSIFVMIAINATIVTALMLRVAHNAFEGFTELVVSREELAVQRSEAQRLANEKERLAMSDALTNLPNRRLFFSQLEDRVRQSGSSSEKFVVGILDLDSFKPVNDIYGHAVGDQLLIEVGKRLDLLSAEDAVVARLGGDEFGLILDGDIEEAREAGERILSHLDRPFQIDGNEFTVGGSIGFACFPAAGQTASVIFDRADYALYNSKAKNKGAYSFFTPELETRLRRKTAIEAELRSANLAKELTVDVQPILCLKTGSTVGIEALARWENAQIGRVEPADFIEVAEQLNLMGNVTTTLFGKFLNDARALPEYLDLSFNLSTHDIVNSSTLDALIDTIDASGISPTRITFEITETALVCDYIVANKNLERLRSIGVLIALDDFGTGFSSLSYLNFLPIDKLKLDRSFVRNLPEQSASKIVSAIVGMCETLELECIVEGVETQQQFDHLLRLGCSTAQGFLFSHPMTIKELRDWLDSWASETPFLKRQNGLHNVQSYEKLHELYGRD